jgi:hypothetical protein
MFDAGTLFANYGKKHAVLVYVLYLKRFLKN